ncbi:hypothetical protein HGRIS_001504 [Hohenbuehelia grisea]|uniref:Uncharacterized protein n=1 Tax=Hohenbuehelia grisea TaxID=104357 RepID=A0ABR3JPJ2_9AGAR
MTDNFDGEVCKSLPGADGCPFFENPRPPGAEELRIGLTLGVDCHSCQNALKKINLNRKEIFDGVLLPQKPPRRSDRLKTASSPNRHENTGEVSSQRQNNATPLKQVPPNVSHIQPTPTAKPAEKEIPQARKKEQANKSSEKEQRPVDARKPQDFFNFSNSKSNKPRVEEPRKDPWKTLQNSISQSAPDKPKNVTEPNSL